MGKAYENEQTLKYNVYFKEKLEEGNIQILANGAILRIGKFNNSKRMKILYSLGFPFKYEVKVLNLKK